MTADQAARLLAAAEADEAMRAYVVVSLLTGARAEELRALTWTHVDLEANMEAQGRSLRKIRAELGAHWRTVNQQLHQAGALRRGAPLAHRLHTTDPGTP